MRHILTAAVVLALFTGAANAAFIAETRTLTGEVFPLPEALEPVHTGHLLELQWSQFNGSRTRVAINKVDNTSGTSTYTVVGDDSIGQASYDYKTVPVQGIEAMLTDVLNRTNRFRLVERQAIDNVLKEQDFGASGRVAQPSAAKIGGVLGAQYLVEAVITHYESGVSKSNVGGAIGGLVGGGAGALLGAIGTSKSSAAFGMNIRLIDATTSEVIFTKQINRNVTEGGWTFGGAGIGGGAAAGGFIGNYTKTPIGQTVLAAINEAAYDLIKQIGAQPAAGSVVKADPGQVIINLGLDQVQNGDTLKLMRKGEALIDPETGISLGSDDKEIGQLQVRDAKDKFSIASVVGSVAGGIKPGDRVISTRVPEPLEYGPLIDVLTKAPPKKAKPERRSRRDRDA